MYFEEEKKEGRKAKKVREGEKKIKLSRILLSWPVTRARIERDIFTSVPVFARKRLGGELSE